MDGMVGQTRPIGMEAFWRIATLLHLAIGTWSWIDSDVANTLGTHCGFCVRCESAIIVVAVQTLSFGQDKTRSTN
jgi:hypothetical protein